MRPGGGHSQHPVSPEHLSLREQPTSTSLSGSHDCTLNVQRIDNMLRVSGYEYLFDGCCRDSRGLQERLVFQYRGIFSLSACEALCDSESDCIAIEVNGCLRDPSCPDRCYTFTGNTGTITNGNCDTSGNQKCYQRPSAGEQPLCTWARVCSVCTVSPTPTSSNHPRSRSQ